MNDVSEVSDFRLITLAVARRCRLRPQMRMHGRLTGESKRNTAAPAACSAAAALTARSMRRGPTAMAV